MTLFKLMRACILTILCIIFLSQNTYCQIDTEFWFAPPDVTAGHGQLPISLRLATLDEAAQVKVYIPAKYPYSLFTIDIGSNSAGNIDLSPFINELETKALDNAQKTGLYIKSTAPVSAYYEIGHGLNADIFALKGANAIGNNFIIPSQSIWSNENVYNFQPAPNSSFDIVATRNNTVVWVTPSEDVIGHPKGQTFIVKLNRGETYSVTNVSKQADKHLGGSVVRSNKPIAITLKEDSLYNPTCADVIGDQLVPTKVAGLEYVILRGYLGSDEYAIVTAIEDGTEVLIQGSGSSVSVFLDKGEMYEHIINAPATYISSSQPVYVTQITGFGCEMGMAVIPSINCRGSKQISFVRATTDFFAMNILVRKAGVDNFSFNGDETLLSASDFNQVPGSNDEWYYAQRPLKTSELGGGAVGRLTNSSHSFQVGIINGDETSTTKFGYFSAFSTLFIGDDTKICDGQSITLDAGFNKDSYLWSTGETTQTITVSEAGTYSVTTIKDNCELSDNITIEIQPLNNYDLGSAVRICEGDFATLDAKENFSYRWEDGSTDRYFITNQPGFYTVDIIDYTGCYARDSIEVIVSSPPEFELGEDIYKCPKDTVILSADLSDVSFSWNTGSSASSINAIDSGYYILTATLQGCSYTDSLFVHHYPEPSEDSISGTSVVCPFSEDILYMIDSNEGETFEWFVDGGALSEVINPNEIKVNWLDANPNATIKALITNESGCVGDTVLLDVRINELLAPMIPLGPDTICLNYASNVFFSTNETNGSVYTWNTSATIQGQGNHEVYFDFPTAGKYYIYVEEHSETSQTVCDGSSPIKSVLVYQDSVEIKLDLVTVMLDDYGLSIIWSTKNFDGQKPKIALHKKQINESDWYFLDSLHYDVGTYIDQNVDVYVDAYEYKLEFNNSCDELIATAPHNSILLTGVSDTLTDNISLKWNPYEGWGNSLVGYEIWRSLEKNEFTKFLELDAQTLSFEDLIGGDGFEHSYKIKALSSDGKESWSNEVSFLFKHPIFIPNVITPNGDGINDKFVIRKLELYPDAELTIYNRFGSSVFRRKNYQSEFEAKGLSSGVYFYQLNIPEKGGYSGTITVFK